MEENKKKSLIKIISSQDNECEEINEKKENKSSKESSKNKEKITKPSKNNGKSRNKEKEKQIKIGNYLIKKTLGKGTFGKVKLGIYLPKKKKVAIKILEKRRLKEEDDLVRLKREFEILSLFNHPNVIIVSEIFETSDAYFTVMEYCEGGELFNYIVKNKFLSEEKSAFFYYQLISGLEYIHSLGIVHRDLKPENLLLTQDHILKIIDFGLSNYFKSNQIELLETPCGSPCYASPEMLAGENYDGFKIDIWATGIILFAMLCGFLPFDHKDNDILFMKILECKIQYPKTLSKEAKDLIKKILVPDPNKRISIPEIKKHPFYLKGKEIFESNFTVYQVSHDEMSISDISSSNNNTIDNNFFFYEYHHKSETIFTNIKFNYKMRNIYNKRYNSMEITRFISYNHDNKMVNIEKEMKNINKKLKKKKGKKNKEKDNLLIDDIKKNFLKYNRSNIFKINDIIDFCENLIDKYKKEEKNNLNKKTDNNKLKKNKIVNENKPNNISKQKSNNNSKNKNNIGNSNNNMDISINKNNNLKNKVIERINGHNYNNSKLKDKIKEKDHEKNIKKSPEVDDKKKKAIDINNQQNKKLLNQTQNNNQNIANKNNIKVNIKKRHPIKINKLYINNNKIQKINKLPKNLNIKKFNRRIKSTSISSKTKNIKNILNLIKQQSLNPNINIINKKNVIHHYTTNITNLTQKNFYSNVIINNFKIKDNHKNNSSSQNKTKKPQNISEIQNDKKFNNESLNKNYNQGLNFTKKNNLKNWKLNNNLQKLVLKEELLFKNAIKHNSKNTKSIDINYICDTDDEKAHNNLTIRNKKSNNKEISSISKTIPNTNDKRKPFKSKIRNINYNNFNNNIKFINKNNNEYSFEYSLIKINNIDNLNNSKKDKPINTYINTNNSVESKDLTQSNLNQKKRFEKLISNNINMNLNLDKKVIKNKVNNSSVENNNSNRSYNYNYINNFDISKINNNSNLVNNNNNNNNNSTIKKIENMKKNNLYFKNKLNYKKCPKINLRELFGIDNITKKDITSLSIINYKKQVQTQRNKPMIMNNNKKNIELSHYLNSIRTNDSKISNDSYNIGNNCLTNIGANTPFHINRISNIYKFKSNQNNLRNNKDLINVNLNNNSQNPNSTYKNKNEINNITSDNIKMNANLIKSKNLLYTNQIINTNPNNNINYNSINKNMINKNKINSNIYLNNYAESKKLFSSLRKRINFKSNLMNNNVYIEKLLQNKTLNNSIKNKEINNKNIKNKSLIVNYNNTNQFKSNNTIEYKTSVNKNNFNYNNIIAKHKLNSLKNEKKNHKKIKSMKDSLNTYKNKSNQNKINNNIKNLNIEINNTNDIGVYICNTDENSNTFNYINILDNNFNTLDNNRIIYPNKNSNLINIKKNNIIKKMSNTEK